MKPHEIDRIQCAIRHIKTAVDVDPWAVEIAVDAMWKQIPIKPIGKHYAHMRCPSCNHRIPSGQGSSSRRRDNWCNYCGQAIYWSDE
jgi:DNA-directed RNA polymerase subunit RPC12/RpoP